MNRSFERGVWQVTKHFVVPALLFAHSPGSTDPLRKPTGYGGVLTVPVSVQAITQRDSVQAQRKDRRAARGRILYADGHTEPSSASTRAEPKPAPSTCPSAAPSRSGALRTS